MTTMTTDAPLLDVGADGVTAAFGASQLRLDVLRFVIGRGSVTTAEVMREHGLSRNGALRHLRALRASGVVASSRTTHPRGAGPVTYWTAREKALEELVAALRRHLYLATHPA